MANSRRINVLSLDFDGCIFHWDYIDSASENRLIETNQAFIQSISIRITEQSFHEAILMVGSNRQDMFADKRNGELDNKGSCYPALVKLRDEFANQVQHVHLCIDDYLLADTYGKKNPGATFQAVIKQDFTFKHDLWLFDESKMTILYAQMHKIASEKPDAEIILDFYDDTDKVIAGLRDFFQSHADLMPSNVTLRLHRYRGKKIRDIAEIQGSGQIDHHYQANLWRIVECAGLDYEKFLKYPKGVNVIHCLKVDGLTVFKSQREAFLQEQQSVTVAVGKASVIISRGTAVGLTLTANVKGYRASAGFNFFDQMGTETTWIATSFVTKTDEAMSSFKKHN